MTAPQVPSELPEHILPETSFLEKNWVLILKSSAAVAVIAAALSLFQCSRVVANRKESAALASAAENIDSLRSFVSAHRGGTIGSQARLLLARSLIAEGKGEEALQLFREVAATAKDDVLASSAALGQAQTLELLGKNEEALQAYQQVTASRSKSFVIPLAMLSQGRLYASSGKIEEARRLFKDIGTGFPESSVASEASARLAQLPAAPAPQATSTPAAQPQSGTLLTPADTDKPVITNLIPGQPPAPSPSAPANP